MPSHNRPAIAVLALAAVCALLPPAASAITSQTGFNDIGIDQKLGGLVPLDAMFRGEQGESVTLGSLVTMPTILALVYYQCPNVCDLLLTGMAGVLGPLTSEPGKDYRVVTISIDPRETPKIARESKRRTFQAIMKPYPDDAWRFLTGDQEQIDRVAAAVGFHYMRDSGGFDHPVALIILSPAGKVVRYMLGADFLPADLTLSLMEAQKGAIGPTIAKLARICFRVDPKSHAFVFQITKVVATVTLVMAGSLAAYLVVAGRKRKQKLSGS
jgi:protein SCO1/2